MTVVYTLGNGSQWYNNELRYSIRSFVKYTAVDRIIVVGFKPDWLINVEHIPHDDGPRKQLNIHLKTLAACEVCSEFIQAADDHFVLKPTDFSVYYHGGLLRDQKNMPEKYQAVIDNTLKELPRGLFFNLHIPMSMKAGKYRRTVSTYDWKNTDYLVKSLYANRLFGHDYKTEQAAEVKVARFMRRDAIEKFVADKGFLSVGDAGLSVDMKKFLAERFPDKSIYEK